MQMDIYERESYTLSISNLVMLKAFYNAGVDVTNIGLNDYFVDVQGYSINSSMDLLMGGLESLFTDTKLLHYEELEAEDNYTNLFNEGIPESVIFVSNSKIAEVLSSNYALNFRNYLYKELTKSSYTDVEVAVSDHTSEIAVQIWHPGPLHEIAMSLIKVFEKADKLYQTLESEKQSGISNNDNRQIA